MSVERSERENLLVLQAVRALLGLISSDVLAVSIEMKSDRTVLHFALKRQTDEVGEDIEDIIFEMDALLEGSELLESSVHEGAPDMNWSGRAGRLIYLAKDS